VAPVQHRPRRVARTSLAIVVGAAIGALALYPWIAGRRASRDVSRRVAAIEERHRTRGDVGAPLSPALSLRVRRLGPLLASWEAIGGCGAGGTGGAGVGVKWIGRSTTGGLFQTLTQSNYIQLNNAYNFILSEQITRDLGQKWSVGVFVPMVYKRYNDYLGLPVDISNSGLGDVNLLVTRRFGRINSTSVTAALGFPTGVHDARYKGDLLTQEKQLGIGKFTGSLMLDHTLDQSWGVIVLGALGAYRGGENELGNYRAPSGSVYTYAGYFLGPFVPSLGLAFTGYLKPDRDRGIEQDVPLTLLAGNVALEWSTDWIAILAGVSVPYAFTGSSSDTEAVVKTKVTGLQPWMAAIGVSLSPF
jgi:hypothetical protein